MKKIFFLVFAILINNSIQAQIKGFVVEYDVYYNTEYPIEKKGTLIINEDQTESLFLSLKKGSTESKAATEGTNITLVSNSKKPLFNHFNFKSNKLLSKEKILFDKYIVEEKIPKLKWDLLPQEKQIGNIKVKKARTLFRGRVYEAWYSLEYPFRFGPWKLQGLPGLIIEVYDETKRYHWVLSSVKTENISKEVFDLDTKDSELITLKEYVKKRYTDDLDLRLKSRLPRDIKINSTKTERPKKRTGKEIIFEWEEDNSDGEK
jgi:GLPGLI family protein